MPTDLKKIQFLEEWLADLNNILSIAEIEAVAKCHAKPQLPVCFIVAAPGSGSHILMQWMASTGAFSYTSNLISRFYKAPYIGAKIQRLLTDPDLAGYNELNFPIQQGTHFYENDIAGRMGIFAPSEFDKFWQRFFKFNGTDQMHREELDNIPVRILQNELAGLESVARKPLALNVQYLNSHISFLATHFENAIFVYLKRTPFFALQTLMETRKKYNGTYKDWVGFRPPEYEKLTALNPFKQVCGQFHFSQNIIEKQLANLNKQQKLIVNYEDLCDNPQQNWERLNNRFNKLGFTLHKKYSGLSSFKNDNVIRLSKIEKDRLAAAWYSLFGKDITPDRT